MASNLFAGVYNVLRSANSAPTQQGFGAQMRAKINVARWYVRSYQQASKNDAAFDEIQSYCIFLGHARSGGSLAGGLLDAHPNAVIADEVDIFPFISAGFTRDQIYSILLDRSRIQADKGRSKAGRNAKTYSYMVPDQWQGKYRRLLVIGNRKAGISTRWMGRDQSLIDRLQKTIGDARLKMIVSVRNPYDTISTMNIRSGRELSNGVEQYFANCQTIQALQKTIPAEDFLILRHENLLADPTTHIKALCHFLNLEAFENYVRDCKSILFKAPSMSRLKVTWTPDLVRQVSARVQEFEFLQGYSFEN